MLGTELGEQARLPLRPELEPPEAMESWVCDNVHLQSRCRWDEIRGRDRGLPRSSQAASLVYTVVPHNKGLVSDMVEGENQPKVII